MLNIAPFNTPRLQVRLRELKGRDAILLCQMPVEQSERGTSELLARIVEPVEQPRTGQVVDQRLWSVQERALVVAHYLASMHGGDFAIGDKGKYSNYMMDTLGVPPPPVSIGTIGGKAWSMQPLLGWHAESIERLVFAEELEADRRGWIIGAMAAQLFTDEDGPLDLHDLTDAEIDGGIGAQCVALMDMPESDLMYLVRMYLVTLASLDHGLRMNLNDDGIVFMPSEEVPGLPPARFHFPMAIREDTLQVFGGAH
jgi:hypothetical protein